MSVYLGKNPAGQPGLVISPDSPILPTLFVAVSNDDLRRLQRSLERYFSGPPSATSWPRKTQTADRADPCFMDHHDNAIYLEREQSTESLSLSRKDAEQVRDYLDYWLNHWMQEEQFPQTSEQTNAG